MNEIQPLLDLLGGKLPWLPTAIVWLGALKLFFHFTGGFIQSGAAAFMVRIVDSPDPNDDHFLLVVLDSRIYQFIRFLLQVASLPLPARADYDLMLKKKGVSAGAIVPLLLFLLLSPLLVFGCAHIQPGQDPIVVNVERAQKVAAPTFDLLLETDNANRAFWQQNVPAFHGFCEWLRQPQMAFLADGTPTNVQRVIAVQLNLDKVKLDYKASKTDSNAVMEAFATLKSMEAQANAWLVIMTNATPTAPKKNQ